MTDRFDNLSIEQLHQADVDARAEAKAVQAALAVRLEVACPAHVRVDGIYRVSYTKEDSDYYPLKGRIVKVTNITAQRQWGDRDRPMVLLASVRPKLISKRDTPTNDGFGRKHHWISPARLEPIE